ncbi:MAG: PIN domain nuclease [Actinobacteria bacterium]|nr:PIN domain nuclease [Actinomycetota bacterium]
MATTGALIGIERSDRRLQALIHEAATTGGELAVPAGVVAHAWGAANRQARRARFLALATVTVVPVDEPRARAAGALRGHAGTAGVIDASVVVCARMWGHG